MKRIMFLLVAASLGLIAYALPAKEYVVVAGESISGDVEWMNVAKMLQKKHKAALISYKDSLGEIAVLAGDGSPLCGDCRETRSIEPRICNQSFPP